jgi:hypothetical protein
VNDPAIAAVSLAFAAVASAAQAEGR